MVRTFRVFLVALATLSSSSADTLPVSVGSAGADDWLNMFKEFSGYYGSVAALFEWDPEAGEETWKSHVWSHAFGLVGSLANLIEGFIGTDSTSDQIAQLQSEIDGGLDKLQNDLNNLLGELDEDFMKLKLAPYFSTLHTATRHLSQFSKSNKDTSDRSIFLEQMEPISDRVEAWKGMSSCLLGQTCPSGMYSSILNSGTLNGTRGLPVPIALSQFAAAHYTVLASAATAICTYDYLAKGTKDCPSIDKGALLQDVAKFLSQEVQEMKSNFWDQMGADKVVNLIDVAVQDHKDNGFDGAVVIRDIVSEGFHQWYYLQNMSDFFGFQSFMVAIYQDVSGSDHHYMWASGFKFRYHGYNIMYDFSNGGEQFGYTFSDCDDSAGASTMEWNSQLQAQCLRDMHDAKVWCLNDMHAFWATASLGAFFHEFYGARMVNPGRAIWPDGSPVEPSSLAGRREFNGIYPLNSFFQAKEGVAVPPPATSGMESQVVPRGLTVSTDPSTVFQDLSNVFNTIGAVAALFVPEGEFVTLIMGVASQLSGLLSGLFGIGQDPVTDALKALEKDVLNRIQVAKNTVDQIRNTVKFGVIAQILGGAEDKLKNLNDHYHTLVQSHDDGAKAEFVSSVDVVSKYIDGWQLVLDCLAGDNLDCVLQGQTALQILAHHGKNWYCPVSLAQSVQYYMQLLQQSAFAICTYDLLRNGNQECKLLPDWNTSLIRLGSKVSKVMEEVRADFWNSMGGDRVPEYIDHYIQKFTNPGGADGAVKIRDAVAQEVEDIFQGNDTNFSMNLLGWDRWTLAVYEDVSGSDQHYMWASGFKFRYQGFNIMYAFSGGTPSGYSASDCQDSDAQKQCTCLRNMHDALVWCLNSHAFWATYFDGSYYEATDGGARSVTPGYVDDGSNDTHPTGWGDGSIGNLAMLLV